jgi:hypothetical protein
MTTNTSAKDEGLNGKNNTLLIAIEEAKFEALVAKVDALHNLVETLLAEKNNLAGYISQEDAEKLTGLSKSTLYKLRKRGELLSSSFGGRDVYYKRSDMEALLRKNEKRL